MLVQVNPGTVTWSVVGNTPTKLGVKAYYLDEPETPLLEEEFTEDVAHQGEISVGYWRTLVFEWERFTLDEEDNKIVQDSSSETTITLPEWTAAISFYPRETSVTIKIETSVSTEFTSLLVNGSPFEVSGTGTTHTAILPAQHRGEQFQVTAIVTSGTEYLEKSVQAFSLPPLGFELISYHRLFIDAANISLPSGVSGLEQIILGTINLAQTVPVTAFVPTATAFTAEQLQAMQAVLLKFLARFPDGESFVRRFSLWAKYQNLDFEGDASILTADQKLAFLLMALLVSYQIMGAFFQQKLKDTIDTMNQYRLLQFKIEQSGSPEATAAAFSTAYQLLTDSALTLEPAWNYDEAVTF